METLREREVNKRGQGYVWMRGVANEGEKEGRRMNRMEDVIVDAHFDDVVHATVRREDYCTQHGRTLSTFLSRLTFDDVEAVDGC